MDKVSIFKVLVLYHESVIDEEIKDTELSDINKRVHYALSFSAAVTTLQISGPCFDPQNPAIYAINLFSLLHIYNMPIIFKSTMYYIFSPAYFALATYNLSKPRSMTATVVQIRTNSIQIVGLKSPFFVKL